MDISVIVPSYNEGRKIRRCIRALKRQKTEKTYEIIVIDDGSTDGSLQWLSGNGVRVHRQRNQGPAAARNLGVEKARGNVEFSEAFLYNLTSTACRFERRSMPAGCDHAAEGA